MKITAAFDSGNIEVVSIHKPGEVVLRIRKDNEADFFQWFYFRVSNVRGMRCAFRIVNAGEASYPEAWDGYDVCCSYDKINWFRLPALYEEGVFSFEIVPEYDSLFFASFEPYDYEQHLGLISNAQLSPVCRYELLGTTVKGRGIDLLIIGEPSEGKKNIWITGRQHAGETQASWFMEGLVTRLLDESDAVSKVLLKKYDFYIVPMVNPDGAVAGNIRANGAGLDLNRQWAVPDPERAPEVYHILEKMDETGVDLNFDIHADEALPYVFISGIEGIPSWNDHIEKMDLHLKKAWMAINPDMQTEHGYPRNEPGKANLAICSKQVGERFGCLSWTVEMPFKDNANLPEPGYGWTSERCALLGESLLTGLLSL